MIHPRYDPNTFDFDIALFKNSFNFFAHESSDMISSNHAYDASYLYLIETLKTFKTSNNQLIRENCVTT